MDAEDALERRQIAFDALRSEAPPVPRLHLGFEIMLDQPLPEAVLRDARFALAGSRYYLVEFYLSVAAESAQVVLRRISDAGKVPLVAHAERYDACNVETMRAWRAAGAKIQVDARALVGSTARGRNARQLVAAGLADVVAADNHADTRTMKPGEGFFAERGYVEVGQLLCIENPRAVVEDGEMRDAPPIPLREKLWSRVKGVVGI